MDFVVINRQGKIECQQSKDLPLYAMGFTARNQEQMKKNLEALEKAGISYPDTFPVIYPCQRYILSKEDCIEVVSEDTCGEAEFLILKTHQGIFIGVGSDHTDKEIEKTSIIKSKQLCAKHYHETFWKFEELLPHWDWLILRSYQESKDGKLQLYQEGSVENILHPQRVIEFFEARYGKEQEALLFSGSIASLQGLVFGKRFVYELEDPVLGRTMGSQYQVKNIGME